MKVTAIIPAKANSVRVPNKNMRAFGNSTLLGHKIDQLKACNRIDEIVVGSDCDDILHFAEVRGATPRKRDAYHCDERQCSANEMIRNLVAMVECDVVLWAHCTNPLCLPDIYDRAIEAYTDGVSGMFDSLCSVTMVQRHGWIRSDVNGYPYPTNFFPGSERHQLASELPPVWYQNGAIFIQPHAAMLQNSYFYGDCPVLFDIDQPYDLDIDTERDLAIAKAIYVAMRQEASL